MKNLKKQQKYKYAFTLSEVLIALTVIGVIAAITVPALIQNTQKQEYVSALKKTYSTLSQATNMIIAENGSPKCIDEEGNETGWACTADDVYNMYKKYLNNVKECGMDKGCVNQLENQTAGYNFLHGGKNSNNYGKNNMRRLVLADGIQIMFGTENKNCSLDKDGSSKFCVSIFADINGFKKPNTYGRDVFLFVLKEKGLYPAGCDTNEEDEYCTDSSRAGDACTCKVLREGAMNY